MIITLYKAAKGGKTHYYTVHDRQPLLDSPYALCASWRVGLGKERERLHRFQTLLERDKMIRRLIAQRVRDGYKILYTFTRSGLSVGIDQVVALDGTIRSSAPYPDPEAVSLQGS